MVSSLLRIAMWSVRHVCQGDHPRHGSRLAILALFLSSGVSGCYGPMYRPPGYYPNGPVQTLQPGAPYYPGYGNPGQYPQNYPGMMPGGDPSMVPQTFGPGTGSPSGTGTGGAGAKGGDAPPFTSNQPYNPGRQTSKPVPVPQESPLYKQSDLESGGRPSSMSTPSAKPIPIEQASGQLEPTEEAEDLGQDAFKLPK